ncbi:hypothetical protein [Arthrobacter sp. SO3]|uniref:hypothetical protein n=1 Tax=Arthrobacter sp. SO3 TaxID=1897057 RepID=UPI001CFFF5B6|nr:hypothetical protein [Arthrobacter sp. SO3]MCB5292229.1 hypothetical protein [Arthrobacter sp. SO3]
MTTPPINKIQTARRSWNDHTPPPQEQQPPALPPIPSGPLTSGCQHEHACLRCALLRPDPSQINRLQDIIDNLEERITEAEQHGWLGDAEGLRVTLNSAEMKLAQMFKMQSNQKSEVVDLGIPRARSGPSGVESG